MRFSSLLFSLAAVGLLASCASLQLVETPQTPLLPEANAAKTVTIALKDVRFSSALLDIYQIIPGEKFAYGKVLEGVSNLVEYHNFNPTGAKFVPRDEIGAIVLTAVRSALESKAPFHFNLLSTDFKAITVSDADQAGTSAPAWQAVLTQGSFEKGTDAAAFAKAAGTDLTILVSAEVMASDGRGGPDLNDKAIMPLVVGQGAHFVLVDVVTDVEVWNSQGKRVFTSIPPKDKYYYYRNAADRMTLLPDVHSADALDAFAASPAYRDLLAKSAFQSTANYIRYLRPYVLGEYVEVKKEQK